MTGKFEIFKVVAICDYLYNNVFFKVAIHSPKKNRFIKVNQ